MNILFDLMILSLGLSIAGNVFLFLSISKQSKKKRELTYDATALLADLASGPALVKIEYIDKADVFLRSPRHFS